MEDMDVDQVVEIPDTPDRLSAKRVGRDVFCAKDSHVSVAGHLQSSSFTGEECPEQRRFGMGFGSESSPGRRLCTRPLITPINFGETNNMSESLHAPRNAHLFRRTALEMASKIEEKCYNKAQHLEKGKKLCIGVPHKSSSSLQCAPNNGITSSNVYKGKEKVADCSVKGSFAVIDHAKQIEHTDKKFQHTHVKEITMPAPSALSVGAGGRKRLVRNGCISPHNIAIRASQVAECNRTSPGNAHKKKASSEICHSSSCPVDITDIIADDERVYGRGSDSFPSRVSGKGFTHQPSIAKNHDGMPCSSTKEAIASRHGSKNSLRCFGEVGDWRSTQNHLKKIDSTMPDAELYPSSINNVSGRSSDSHSMELIDKEISSSKIFNSRILVAQIAPWHSSSLDHISGSSSAANSVIKRQKKHEAGNKNCGESSSSVPEDIKIVSINSSRTSTNSQSSGSQSRTQHPVIEIDELSPVVSRSNSQSIGCVKNDNTIARLMQIEADEMLARELQEQLNYEEPVSLSDVDEYIARALQWQEEEEATNTATRGRQLVSLPRAPHRQPQSRPAQDNSNRRGAQPRAPSSSRMSQSRNRFRRQSPVFPRGGSLSEFPSDMRIDILEALESAVGDLDARLDNHILQFQRDFNEDDYEMLLALDENNHHVGASGSQINSLPVSIVRSENNDETCAICLDTPSVGDTIRHLPCLHRFHKDCIDPWLRRRTSCPVCKSSIT